MLTGSQGDSLMQHDDGLCWICDDPIEPDRSTTSWHGFGAHRDCARQEQARETPADRLDKGSVMRTTT